MGNIEQILRIGLYHIGAYLFGEAIASGELYQMAAGGVVSIATFAWWWYRNRNTVVLKPPS